MAAAVAAGAGGAGAGGDSAGKAGGISGIRHRVIVDCDPGVDDMWALLFLLVQEDVEVIGITCTMGNHNDMDLLARNSCLALHIANKHKAGIPVVKGQPKPLMTPFHGQSGIMVHGKDGLGETPRPFEADLSPMTDHEYASAAAYLAEKCAAEPGEITIIALGPLTNLATAISLDGSFPTNAKRLVMMGGTVDGEGNKTAAGEANIANDPHAAKIVFGAFPDITMAGLNLTRQVNFSEEFRGTVRDVAGPLGAYMHKFSQYYIDLLESWGAKSHPVHDSSAIMALVHPEIFEGRKVCVDVETQGEITAGETVADWKNHWRRKPQTFVLTKADEARFHAIYIEDIKKYATGELGEHVRALFAAGAKAAEAAAIVD